MQKRFQNFFDQVINLPAFAWVLAGFLIVYVFFFVSPVFLNNELSMQYPTGYLPDINPIGNDLGVLLRNTGGWFHEHKSPYYVHFYPPFTFLFFSPLLLLDDFSQVYYLNILLTVACYFLLAFIAMKMARTKDLSTIVVLFVTGLFSYGFQFELERGQYNVLAFLLCMWGIYLFRSHRRHQLFGYLLFSISIQLKLYPAIFIVFFVDDWKDWKNNVLRFAGIGVFNFLLFFVMGYDIFLEFLRSASTQFLDPEWIWNGNHSIKAFINVLSVDGFNIIRPGILEAIKQRSELLSNLFMFAFLAAFVISIFISAFKWDENVDGFLMLTCMIGALIIPVSNDYKLSLLAAPMMLFFCDLPAMRKRWSQFVSMTLTLGISTAYFMTLVPYKYKPYYLSNTFPLLFLILFMVTVLNIVRHIDSKSGNVA